MPSIGKTNLKQLLKELRDTQCRQTGNSLDQTTGSKALRLKAHLHRRAVTVYRAVEQNATCSFLWGTFTPGVDRPQG